ncbi:MAG: hypothetical protein H6817_00580 [Phycisphaerales bacterium]|nr:hypothetical protein [Phycisphaerales bacterium]
MLIFGIFGAWTIADRAIGANAYTWAARIAQVLSVASVILFLAPNLIRR